MNSQLTLKARWVALVALAAAGVWAVPVVNAQPVGQGNTRQVERMASPDTEGFVMTHAKKPGSGVSLAYKVSPTAVGAPVIAADEPTRGFAAHENAALGEAAPAAEAGEMVAPPLRRDLLSVIEASAPR